MQCNFSCQWFLKPVFPTGIAHNTAVPGQPHIHKAKWGNTTVQWNKCLLKESLKFSKVGANSCFLSEQLSLLLSWPSPCYYAYWTEVAGFCAQLNILLGIQAHTRRNEELNSLSLRRILSCAKLLMSQEDNQDTSHYGERWMAIWTGLGPKQSSVAHYPQPFCPSDICNHIKIGSIKLWTCGVLNQDVSRQQVKLTHTCMSTRCNYFWLLMSCGIDYLEYCSKSVFPATQSFHWKKRTPKWDLLIEADISGRSQIPPWNAIDKCILRHGLQIFL